MRWREETTLARNAIRGRLQTDIREGLEMIRPHEVWKRQRDPVALHVEGETECRYLKHLLMQTRVELRQGGRRDRRFMMRSCLDSEARPNRGRGARESSIRIRPSAVSGCSILHR